MFRGATQKQIPAFKWRTLIALIDNKAFSSVYYWLFILPVIAKLTEKLPNIFQVKLQNEVTIQLVFQLPFSWYALYSAAVCISIARVIYTFNCPQFPTQYSNAGDAIQKGITIQSIVNQSRDFVEEYFVGLRKMTRQDFGNLDTFAKQFRIILEPSEDIETNTSSIRDWFVDSMDTLIFPEPRNKPGYYNLEGITIEKSQIIKHAFRDWERFLISTYHCPRLICSILICLGFLLLFCVSFQSLTYVVSSFFNS